MKLQKSKWVREKLQYGPKRKRGIMMNRFNYDQVCFALKMNFKDWDLFRTFFVVRYLIARYKDWIREK